jgi:predicted deacylase
VRVAATQLRSVPTILPPSPSPLPTEDPFAIDITPADVPPPATLDPLLLTQVAMPTAQALPAGTMLIGRSAGGRALLARRMEGAAQGDARVLLLVGGMHGGWEANTVALINALIAYFADHPQEIPPGIALAFVPVANPDGLPQGREAAGRFNANGVDLNRNWGCGWQREAYWRDLPVNAGMYAFSEPETSALADYIQTLRPMVALFYHSAAGGVYAGSCEQSIYGAQGGAASSAMATVYGEAARYRYGEEFSAYPVTGTAAGWAAGLGIAAADVELQTWTQPEFERNLRAIRAVMAWMAERGE